jgi:putative transposase
MVMAAARRQGVEFLLRFKISLRRACAMLGMSRSSLRYKTKEKRDDMLTKRIKEIAGKFKRFGYRRIWAMLRREGTEVNHKRIRRMCKALGLTLPRRAIRKRRGTPGRFPYRAAFENHVWTYDFVFDSLVNGRQIKILTVADEFTRMALAIHVDTSIRAGAVIKVLKNLFGQYQAPRFIRSDNGPEFIAKALQQWLRANGSETLYITPGSPWENAYGESFNGKLRDECLNMEIFRTIADAKFVAERYQQHFNTERPHSSLHYLTPLEFKTGNMPAAVRKFLQSRMSLSHSGTPDGQSRKAKGRSRKRKRQSHKLCPSVCSPVPALESLSSVALSSGQAIINISSSPIHDKNETINPGD